MKTLCTRCKKPVHKYRNHWSDVHGNRKHIRCQKEEEQERSERDKRTSRMEALQGEGEQNDSK